jgi:hypothetical protein
LPSRPHLLDGAEGRPAEPLQLEDELLPVLVRGEEDVALLADADLHPDAADSAHAQQRPQREEVVAAVGEPVAVVLPALVVDELEPEEVPEDLVRAAAAHARRARDQLGGDEVVVAHPGLHGSEHAEVVRGHVPQGARVELHSPPLSILSSGVPRPSTTRVAEKRPPHTRPPGT